MLFLVLLVGPVTSTVAPSEFKVVSVLIFRSSELLRLTLSPSEVRVTGIPMVGVSSVLGQFPRQSPSANTNPGSSNSKYSDFIVPYAPLELTEPFH